MHVVEDLVTGLGHVQVPRRAAGDQVVQRRSQAEHVRPFVHVLGVGDLLGSHEPEGPHGTAGHRHALELVDPRDPEVGHLTSSRPVDQDVLRLDVAMDDAVRVRVRDSGGHRNHDRHGQRGRHRSVQHGPVPDAAALCVVERHPRNLLFRSDVDDPVDVGMLEAGHRMGLVLEALADPGLSHPLRQQDLDGPPELELPVPGEEHGRSGPRAESARQHVAVATEHRRMGVRRHAARCSARRAPTQVLRSARAPRRMLRPPLPGSRGRGSARTSASPLRDRP